MRLREAVAVERIFTSIHGLLSCRQAGIAGHTSVASLNEAVGDCLALEAVLGIAPEQYSTGLGIRVP